MLRLFQRRIDLEAKICYNLCPTEGRVGLSARGHSTPRLMKMATNRGFVSVFIVLDACPKLKNFRRILS